MLRVFYSMFNVSIKSRCGTVTFLDFNKRIGIIYMCMCVCAYASYIERNRQTETDTDTESERKI